MAVRYVVEDNSWGGEKLTFLGKNLALIVCAISGNIVRRVCFISRMRVRMTLIMI